MRTIILIFISVFTIVSCKEQSKFYINGKLPENSEVSTIILATETEEVMDTVFVSEYKFNFEGTITEPTFAAVVVNGKIFRFHLTNDIIDINITDIMQSEFTTSYKSSQIKENIDNYFNRDAETYLYSYKELMSQEVKSEDESEKNTIRILQDSLSGQFLRSVFTEYSNIKNRDGLNIITRDLIGLIGTKKYPEMIEEIYNLLPVEQKNGFYGKKIQTYLDQSSKIALGQNIDFSFVDINGTTKKINEFKGKLVLLEFWATWCGPCIAQLPELKKIYQSDKIEIISISIDDNIDQWKNKTPGLGMNWTNIHYKQSENLKEKFFITGVPDNILLSQDGYIIRKNIQMSELIKLVE